MFTTIRGVSTGLYTTSTSEEWYYILEDSKASIVAVENQKLLDKIIEVLLLYVSTYMFI